MMSMGTMDEQVSNQMEATSAHQEAAGGRSAGTVTKKVPVLTRFLYSLPSLPLSIAGVMVSTFVPKLYSDTYGVPISSIGLISIGALVFDALTDPLVGFASDRTRTRWGRRRPYILCGGVLLACAAGALLAPSPGLSVAGLTGWACVCILLVFLASTLVRVPWLALGVELTAGVHEEKTAVFATREVVWIVGSILAAGLPIAAAAMFGDGASDNTESLIQAEQKQFRFIAAIVGFVTLVSVALCVRFVQEDRYAQVVTAEEEEKERTQQRRQEEAADDVQINQASGKGCGCAKVKSACQIFPSYRALLGDLLSTKPGLSLFVASTLYSGATSLNAFFFAYFVEYAVDAEDDLELVLIVYILFGVLFIPLWVRVGQRLLEKYQLLKLAMCIQTFVLLLAFALLGKGDLYLYLPLVSLAGVSFGGFAAFKFSMIGDLADVDEAQNGFRREGEIQGAFDLCGKLMAAAVIGPAVIILDNVGYSPNIEQPTDALLVIRVCYALAPAILGILAIVALAPYDLSREKYQALVHY